MPPPWPYTSFSGHKQQERYKKHTVRHKKGVSLWRAAVYLVPQPDHAPIAQLVEHLICNQGVAGSSPAGGTRYHKGPGCHQKSGALVCSNPIRFGTTHVFVSPETRDLSFRPQHKRLRISTIHSLPVFLNRTTGGKMHDHMHACGRRAPPG